MGIGFVIQSIFLGVGLAMDATCVAMTNGLNYPSLKKKHALLIAFMYGFFQALMPLIGYLLGVSFNEILSKFTPVIALIILSILGFKMLLEGLKKCEDEEEEVKPFNFKLLFIQAIATAIDATLPNKEINVFKNPFHMPIPANNTSTHRITISITAI